MSEQGAENGLARGNDGAEARAQKWRHIQDTYKYAVKGWVTGQGTTPDMPPPATDAPAAETAATGEPGVEPAGATEPPSD